MLNMGVINNVTQYFAGIIRSLRFFAILNALDIIRKNRFASGVKFIAACGVASYTVLILPTMWPIRTAK